MRLIPQLELADCRAIVIAAQAEADRRAAVVSLAVVDSGGHPLLVERRDGASPASVEAALAKARMAALNGKPTEAMEAAINGQRPALVQLSGAMGEPSLAMAGGLPLLHEGVCLGAIGVSGMTPDVDGAIAAAGVAGLP
ncbi:MAG: heme-binding protein [Synechococcaceae cyanobacterium ELA263]